MSATASVAGRSFNCNVLTATRVIDRMTGRARQGARDRREEHDVHVIHCSPTPRRISVRNTVAASERVYAGNLQSRQRVETDYNNHTKPTHLTQHRPHTATVDCIVKTKKKQTPYPIHSKLQRSRR